MKKMLAWLGLALIVFASCSTVPRPYYETKLGKQKQRYYNAIQYGKKDVPNYPKSR
ncbi:MAG: hypothetical protein KF803_03620 [Cyclobacteriaceae bacterium]|nr:hypothetical protein [Cyclobacteriaceae bacterium]